jgi:hypothetical protein
MRVGYSRGWSIAFLVLGGITIAINLLARNPLGFVPGARLPHRGCRLPEEALFPD